MTQTPYHPEHTYFTGNIKLVSLVIVIIFDLVLVLYQKLEVNWFNKNQPYFIVHRLVTDLLKFQILPLSVRFLEHLLICLSYLIFI